MDLVWLALLATDMARRLVAPDDVRTLDLATTARPKPATATLQMVRRRVALLRAIDGIGAMALGQRSATVRARTVRLLSVDRVLAGPVPSKVFAGTRAVALSAIKGGKFLRTPRAYGRDVPSALGRVVSVETTLAPAVSLPVRPVEF